MSSAISLNLDQSEILSSGNGLNNCVADDYNANLCKMWGVL